ncbi:hypothetical protein JVU11DRAFT_2559 [Chiua virens]|nr:hypothetical protein JVU11DRAFT_2559 [Chiua virens]
MDQAIPNQPEDPLQHPDFDAPSFATLIKPTMETQWINHEQAIAFLGEHWAKTGFGGISPVSRPNRDPGGDGGALTITHQTHLDESPLWETKPKKCSLQTQSWWACNPSCLTQTCT